MRLNRWNHPQQWLDQYPVGIFLAIVVVIAGLIVGGLLVLAAVVDRLGLGFLLILLLIALAFEMVRRGS
jgi:maltodextrin utilization protein YvdJ